MGLEPSILRVEFERCWPWLDDALGFGAFTHDGRVWKTHSREDVWNNIINRRNFFWRAPNSAMLTFFNTSPTGLKSHYTWLAGGKREEIVDMTPLIEDWGRANYGCHRQAATGRRGWLRELDGYREIGVAREKDLIG